MIVLDYRTAREAKGNVQQARGDRKNASDSAKHTVQDALSDLTDKFRQNARRDERVEKSPRN